VDCVRPEIDTEAVPSAVEVNVRQTVRVGGM
jgi:hypothetical protein